MPGEIKLISRISIIVFLTFSLNLFGLKPSQTKPLLPNTVIEDTLVKKNDDEYRLVYSVTLTNETLQAEFKVLESAWDIDIYLSTQNNLNDYSEVEFAQANQEKTEELVINRFWGDGKLKTGSWYLYLVARPPQDLRERAKSPTFKLAFRTVAIAQQQINQGVYRGTLSFENGSSQFYYVDIPRGVETYTFALTDCEMDTDIILKRDRPILSQEDADIISNSYLAREIVVLRSQEIGRPITGRWYIVVTQKPVREYSDQYQLFVGPGVDVPASFKVIPNPLHPPTTDPLVRAAYSVVEILHDSGGGSGCLVSSSGLIVTNNHVITDLSRKTLREVVVAMTQELDRPTKELFWAEVLWSNEELDLAILQIRRGLYNQPLPEGLRFPFLTVNTQIEPGLGTAVWALGYPYWGGRGSKTSITLSRGIVSGFDKTRYGKVYKIDASVNHGSSGGAVLNEQLQLIGIATSIVFDQSGQLGFAHPVKMIPQSWLERMGR